MKETVAAMNKRVKINSQDKNIRQKNFDEVTYTLNDEEARYEASRCLNCQNPSCVKGCPVGINIPKFIEAIKNNDLINAVNIIKEQNSMPSICGRVCPQEKQCEEKCIRGLSGDAIAIGALERYVGDMALKNKIESYKKIEENGYKVAIIGSGPSGLTCASDLRKMGYSVTIYESLHKAGGVLCYGIPEFRLPKYILNEEIESIKKLGVNIITDTLVGKTITLDELKSDYDAIYISTGAGLPKMLSIKGINANGVFSANEILTRINLMESYKDSSNTPIKKVKKAIVIGGGNVAMDAARSLKRLGIDVSIMYHRSETELPARKEEVIHAMEEDIKFLFLKDPVEILTNDSNEVIGIKYISMKKTDKLDETGRAIVETIDNSEDTIDTNMVVLAIGTNINNIAFKDSNIIVNDKGIIEVNDTKTSDDMIFAGGDVATGSATVISACGMGKKAAREINKYLGEINEK